MNNIELVDRLQKLDEYANILKNPDEFFRHMQGHRTELSFVLAAFDVAGEVKQVISALEKFPKKPEVSSFLGPRKEDNYTDYCCPACKSKIVSVVKGYLVGGRKSAFCPDCGQALDWEPSEELKQLLDTL